MECGIRSYVLPIYPSEQYTTIYRRLLFSKQFHWYFTVIVLNSLWFAGRTHLTWLFYWQCWLSTVRIPPISMEFFNGVFSLLNLQPFFFHSFSYGIPFLAFLFTVQIEFMLESAALWFPLVIKYHIMKFLSSKPLF